MQGDTFSTVVSIGFIITICVLIGMQFDLRFKVISRLLCKIGIHDRKTKKDGVVIYKYCCQICTKAKSHPHLRIIEGGKKVADVKFRF